MTWARFRPWLPDILLALLLASGMAFESHRDSGLIMPFIVTERTDDTFFQSDISRTYVNMTQRLSDQYRTSVHPLFPLVAFSTVDLLHHTFHSDYPHAVRAVLSGIAAAWIIALFALLRLIGCRRFDSLLFSVVAAMSASSVFWFAVPETYPLGSLSILLALIAVAVTRYWMPPAWVYVIMSALTLSITITNWAAGLIATFMVNRRQKALLITLGALVLVMGLWRVEKAIFPTAGKPFDVYEERNYVRRTMSNALISVKAELFHSIVIPAVTVNDIYHWHRAPLMSVQRSEPGSTGPCGKIAITAWAILLLLGLAGLFLVRGNIPFRIALGLILLSQMGLHILYGEETFLYGLHFAPLLVVLAALATLTRLRVAALVCAAVVAVSAGMNNFVQFKQDVDRYDWCTRTFPMDTRNDASTCASNALRAKSTGR
jgi:hypothetical protein